MRDIDQTKQNLEGGPEVSPGAEPAGAPERKPNPIYHGGVKERKGKSFSTQALATIRTDLDLTVENFARLLGLSFMTVYNWEKGEGMVEVADIQARILTVLTQMTVHHPDLAWADDVSRAVNKAGGLYGLHKLLNHYFRVANAQK